METSMRARKTSRAFSFFLLWKPTYSATVPLYLDGNRENVYVELEALGQGSFPQLSFDLCEVTLPSVPLDVESQATFHVVNNGYDNLELSHRFFDPSKFAHRVQGSDVVENYDSQCFHRVGRRRLVVQSRRRILGSKRCKVSDNKRAQTSMVKPTDRSTLGKSESCYFCIIAAVDPTDGHPVARAGSDLRYLSL